MYISECSEPHLRGGLASVLQLQSNVGVAFTDALNVNEATPWTVISAVCAAFPVILALVLALFLPESPFYLAQNGRYRSRFA